MIDKHEHADYVYMYPPRQAYRPFDQTTTSRLDELVTTSSRHSEVLNLYVHVPFCRQICGFCNLYAVSGTGQEFDDYVDAVLREAARYAELVGRKQVPTLYLGGGTPSILRPDQLERLVTALLDLFSVDGEPPQETALEVDPATVDLGTLRDIRSAGINRINLGYQSMVRDEVVGIGRRRPETAGLALLEQALTVGFANVCVDLIYGLDGQTDDNWRRSVSQVARIGPPTVCAYSLTLRPHTGYQRRGYVSVDGATLYRRYDMANDILQAAGYRQENHVRWVRDGGGYLQKVNHWALQNILGLGAGARSYLWEVDLRNGYSVRSRARPLRGYLARVSENRSPVTDGYLMTAPERARKAVMLNLVSLDRARYTDLIGADPMAAFADEFAALSSLGLCTIGPDRIALTSTGLKYRDLIAQSLFSEEVRTRVAGFDYDE
ncbi:coproporphyrinogen-III oxidase family protein [Actinophytocola sediminis]